MIAECHLELNQFLVRALKWANKGKYLLRECSIIWLPEVLRPSPLYTSLGHWVQQDKIRLKPWDILELVHINQACILVSKLKLNAWTISDLSCLTCPC